MGRRTRTLVVATVTAIGFGLAAGTAVAAPAGHHTQDAQVAPLGALDYWQFHDHYADLAKCQAVGESYLYPTHPNGADDYACEAKNDGWDLYLIFAT